MPSADLPEPLEPAVTDTDSPLQVRTDLRHVVLVTDAWHPQTNGVVTTLSMVCAELSQLGIRVSVLHPGLFSTLPLPGYPEIRIARNPGACGR